MLLNTVFEKILAFLSPQEERYKTKTPVRGGTLFLLACLFTYSFVFKVYPIGSAFWWAGDQIRDWTIAQRGLFHLPLHGTVRVDGYYSLGPVFYWILSLINILLGPFFDHLPHTAGYGIAFLVSLGEAALAYALLTVGLPRFTVFAFVLLLASAPFASALAGTIWNPPVSVAFTMLALAACLIPTPNFSLRRLVGVIILGLFAIQAHTPTLFMVTGIWIFAVLRCRHSQEFSWVRLAKTSLISTFIVELPYLMHVWRHGSRDWATGPTVFSKTASGVLTTESFSSFVPNLKQLFWILNDLFTFESNIAFLLTLLALSALLMIFSSKYRAELFWLASLPIFLATSALTFSNSHADSYWFISLGAAFILALLFLGDSLLKRWRPVWGELLGIALLLSVITLQTHRWRMRNNNTVMRTYGVMVAGARTLKAKQSSLSKVVGPPKQEQSCAQCLYVLLGGVIDPTSSLVGQIEADGSVSIQIQNEDKQKANY